MTRRQTFSELRWPLDSESAGQAAEWAETMAFQVLDWTWRAFDLLRSEHLRNIDFRQPLDQLERDLTSKHFGCIQLLWHKETDGYPSIFPHHEFPENESRPPPPGKPPAYDLAFVWQDNQRIAWPIEAKVVKTSRTLSQYMGDVRKFLKGTAAPFIGQGALIAYLLAGQPSDFIDSLAKQLSTALQSIPDFALRPHRLSHHNRRKAPAINLHHLVMQCTDPAKPKQLNLALSS